MKKNRILVIENLTVVSIAILATRGSIIPLYLYLLSVIRDSSWADDNAPQLRTSNQALKLGADIKGINTE